MPDNPVPPAAPRPRPILLAQSVLAAVGLVVSAAGFSEHVPAVVAWWIVTGMAGIQIGLAFYLQRQTTPLSAPQDHRGVDLVPIDQVPQVSVTLIPEAAPSAGPLPTTTGKLVIPE